MKVTRVNSDNYPVGACGWDRIWYDHSILISIYGQRHVNIMGSIYKHYVVTCVAVLFCVRSHICSF